MLQAKAATTLASSETGIVFGEWREGATRSLLLDQGCEGSDVDVSDDHEEELRSLVSHLGAGIRDTHYQLAYDAAANVCSGTLEALKTTTTVGKRVGRARALVPRTLLRPGAHGRRALAGSALSVPADSLEDLRLHASRHYI